METAGTLSSVEFSVQTIYLLFCQLISYHSCMEHSLHLVVGHVLSCITPVHTRKPHRARNDDGDDDDKSVGSATDDEASAILSHALRKLLGLIKQVCVIHHVCYIN